MPHLLAILAAISGAVCVWLVVRIVNSGERWATRTLAAVTMLPVLYVASLGPALWLCYQLDQPPWLCQFTMALYPPMFQLMTDDSFVGRLYLAYLEWRQPWSL